ncbi:unnamed protein product [Echinostoma caproni]|uniref:Transposase n=1 Tax=Echinostoma caproni TaxID=27848 RepID=A0A183AZ64_9TREM|nr:unnamed protein product [Echinostoma caproni]
MQHQSPAQAAQRTTFTPRSGSTTLALSPTGHSRNEGCPEPTPVGRTIMSTAAQKDRPDSIPTQLETGKELWVTVARRADVAVVLSVVPQQLRAKSMPATKNDADAVLESYNIQHTHVELPGSRGTVGTTSSQVKEPERPLVES